MKKTSTASSFGAPKPLPGQAGYKVSETEVLKKDAEEMEKRLQALQERMKQQQLLQDEAKTTSGGNHKWKSASKEKGSVTNYGKDVQERYRKRVGAQTGDPVLRPTIPLPSRTAVQIQQKTDFRSKDVETWDVSDVSEWLTAIQLQAYVSTFTQNDINGTILLDINLEDLDYMSITALGHRKAILKGVEDLRKNKRFVEDRASNTAAAATSTIQRTRSNPHIGAGQVDASSTKPTSITMLSSSEDFPQRMPSSSSSSLNPAATNATHWSHLEPLSSNKVNGGKESFANSADSSRSDYLDEAAERQAFKEAVEEWRRQDAESKAAVAVAKGGGVGRGDKPSVQMERVYKGSTSIMQLSSNGNDWKDPFAAPTSKEDERVLLDEAAERRAFQEAVAAWRSGPPVAAVHEPFDDSDHEDNTAASKPSSSSSSLHSSSTRPQHLQSKKLMDGVLDDVREHEEFVKAVESWRKNGSSTSDPAAVAMSAQRVAEQLSKEMEMEKETSSRKLQVQKEDAQRRLMEANHVIAEIRSRQTNLSGDFYSEDAASACDDDEAIEEDVRTNSATDVDFSGYYTYFSAPSDVGRDIISSGPVVSSPASSRPTSSRVPLQDTSSYTNSYLDGSSSSSRVALSLLESVLLDPNRDMHSYDDSNEVEYSVIEAESDSD